MANIMESARPRYGHIQGITLKYTLMNKMRLLMRPRFFYDRIKDMILWDSFIKRMLYLSVGNVRESE